MLVKPMRDENFFLLHKRLLISLYNLPWAQNVEFDLKWLAVQKKSLILSAWTLIIYNFHIPLYI